MALPRESGNLENGKPPFSDLLHTCNREKADWRKHGIQKSPGKESSEPTTLSTILRETETSENNSASLWTSSPASRSTHRSQHLNAFCEVPDEGHNGHLLQEPLDFTELHHEPVFVRQVLHGLPLPLVEPEHFHLILSWQEPHQTFHKVYRQCLQVKSEDRCGLVSVGEKPPTLSTTPPSGPAPKPPSPFFTVGWWCCPCATTGSWLCLQYSHWSFLKTWALSHHHTSFSAVSKALNL